MSGVPDFEKVGFTRSASKTLSIVVGIGALCASILFTGYKIGEARAADKADLERVCAEAISKAPFATKAELDAEKAARNDSVYAVKLEFEKWKNEFLLRRWASSP